MKKERARKPLSFPKEKGEKRGKEPEMTTVRT
jgi:hypothetical protein